jgi:hypothetical protein
MVVLLPNEHQGLAILEEQVDKVFESRKFTQQLVNVKIFKFRINLEFNENLKNVSILHELISTKRANLTSWV